MTEKVSEDEERIGQFQFSEHENDIRIAIQYGKIGEQVFQIDSINESHLVLVHLADDSTMRFTREVGAE